jgi:hypothetical protein
MSETPSKAEDQLRREGHPEHRQRRADQDQPRHDPPRPDGQLTDAQPEARLEEDEADAQRHERLKGIAEERVRVDVVRDGAGRKADRQKEHDRRQPRGVRHEAARQSEHDHEAEPGEDLVAWQHH